MCQFSSVHILRVRANLSKVLCSSVFICPFKHYHVGQMSQFDNFLNGASTMLNSVFKADVKINLGLFSKFYILFDPYMLTMWCLHAVYKTICEMA